MSTHSAKKKKRRSSEQKSIIVLLALVVVLALALTFLLIDNSSLRRRLDEAKNSSVEEVSSVVSEVSSTLAESSSSMSEASSSTPAVSSTPTVSSVSEFSSNYVSSSAYVPDPDDWNLRLANLDNHLPDGYVPETGLITQAYASKNQMQFEKRAVNELNAMLKDANAAGLNLFAVSSYRSVSYQTGLYNNEVQKWLNQGYSTDDAKKKAATIVAVPGTSDHNLGLAVDLNSVEESFENTREFTWLQEHAEDYGFVMRFPKNKQDVTKIIYEPWHYRYVGVVAAKEMNKLGMCLEEYVVYLRGLGR